MVHAIAGHYAILPVEQCEYNTVYLKSLVLLPFDVREQELVSIIKPCGFNRYANSKCRRYVSNVIDGDLVGSPL